MRSATLAVISLIGVGVAGSAAEAAPRAVTVYLERNGHIAERNGEEIEMPRFGGGDRVWNGIVSCVKQHYAPFQVDIVDAKPARGPYITAVVGGLASQLGLDDRITNGVGPYNAEVIPNATVYVFSQVGTGERDVSNLCAVTAHEIAHALGLDHSTKCGDIMSYELDRCGTRKFLDADAPCGEDEERACGDGGDTQNSYRLLVANVGLRSSAPSTPKPRVDPSPPQDPWASGGYLDDSDDTAADDSADDTDDTVEQPEDPYVDDAYARAPQQHHHRHRGHHRHHHRHHRHHRGEHQRMR